MNDSAFSRVIGVLTAPIATFQRIAARPSWLLPAVLTLVATMAVTAVMMPKLDLEQAMRKQLAEAGGNLSAEQIDSQVAIGMKFGKAMAWVGPVVMTPVVLGLMALIFWGTATMVGGRLRFIDSLAVVSHAWVPQVVAALLSIPVVLSKTTIDPEEARGGSFLASHLGVLIDQTESPVGFAVLSSLDVFSFWTLALLGIGLMAVGKLSRGSAAVAVGIPWLVWVVVKAGLSLLPALMKG
jgi:hypothetical protein